MDKYRPCPSIIAMFTSDSQHPPRSIHAVYLGEDSLLNILYFAFQTFLNFISCATYVRKNTFVVLIKILDSNFEVVNKVYSFSLSSTK